MGKQIIKKSLAFAAALLFMLLYTSCSKKDNAQVPENNDVKDDNSQEQSAEELPPTRVYKLNTDKPVPNLFGKEAKEACEQNEERFKPVYDEKTETCHLTVKEPTIQTDYNIRKLFRHCAISTKLDYSKLLPHKKINGVCLANKEHGYKTQISFTKPKTFLQDMIEQCNRIENCTCDKDNKCTLTINDHVVASSTFPHRTLVHDALRYFNFDAALPLRIMQAGESSPFTGTRYSLIMPYIPFTIIYNNVEVLERGAGINSCRLYCFKDNRKIPKINSFKEMMKEGCSCIEPEKIENKESEKQIPDEENRKE